ncbi:MAG: hypothetical protein ACYDDA_12275 [Acidiferrobacteraceae bacterium]
MPASTLSIPLGTGATLQVQVPASTVQVPAGSAIEPASTTTFTVGTPTPSPSPSPVVSSTAMPALSVTAPAAQTVLVGQIFQQGAVPSGDSLSANVPLQLDPIAHYADGSLKLGMLTLQVPAGTTSITVSPVAQPAVATPPTLHTGATATLTIGSATTSFPLDSTSGTTWRSGALAVEKISDTPVSGSLHVIMDVEQNADGTWRGRVKVANDYAMGAVGGPVTYSLVIQQGTTTLGSWSGVAQPQYEDWNYIIGTEPDTANVVHDVAYLESAHAILPYDLTNVPSAATLAAYTTTAGKLTTPLTDFGITEYMPMTGGRADIGMLPGWAVAYLYNQTHEAWQYVVNAAQSSTGIPWYFYIQSANTWATTDNNPDLWVTNEACPCLTQGAQWNTVGTNSGPLGWTPDVAHQPDANYLPYILTGRHEFLENLEGQAAWGVMAAWPSARQSSSAGTAAISDNVIFLNQLRAAAWTLRTMHEVAWVAPDNSPEQAYFAKVVSDNTGWLVSQMPMLQKIQGAAYGYMIADLTYGCCILPWQEDYFAESLYMLAQRGDANALKYLQWAENYYIDSIPTLGPSSAAYVNQAYNPPASSNGQIYWSSTANGWVYQSTYQTWAAIAAANQTAGVSGNSFCSSANWAACNGDYGALRLATLKLYLHLDPSNTTAQSVLTTFEGYGLPYTDPNGVANGNLQFNVN